MKGIIEKVTIHEKPYAVYIAKGATENVPWFYAACGGEDASLLQEIALCTEKTDVCPFVLLQPMDVHWDHDYSPWPCEERFTGGADETIREYREFILPFMENHYLVSREVSSRGITGYSLGGLFALYALFSGEPFGMAASVSGSLWFPGFYEYALSRPLPEAFVYTSLGKAEAKTRAKIMIPNAENTQNIARLFADKGTFAWNNGNHFFEVPKRIALSIQWLLETGRR